MVFDCGTAEYSGVLRNASKGEATQIDKRSMIICKVIMAGSLPGVSKLAYYPNSHIALISPLIRLIRLKCTGAVRSDV
jgi:hypothetical protein